MPYFRDQVVQELTSLYEFLVTMYLPEDALKYPPMPGGWPEISAERLSFMKKADAVIDLMKHIPYIRQDWDDTIEGAYQVHEGSVCNDFSGKYFQDISTKFQYDCDWQLPGDVKTPPHLLILWRPPAPTRGWTVSINIKTGELRRDRVIYGARYDYADIKEFCEFVKEEFQTLVCIPTHPMSVTVVSSHPATEMAAAVPLVKDIYTQCGWPSASFRKQKCVSLVESVMEEAEEKFVSRMHEEQAQEKSTPVMEQE